jgi:tetratricopeptide (TPR) repeat protein
MVLGELVRQDPKDRAALRTLASLEVALERWDLASAALRRLVGIEEGEAVIDTALSLADACERAGRIADARGGLERARMVAPQDEAVRNRLEDVYVKTGAWREVADMALADAKATGDVAGRFSLLVRAGTVLLEQANDAAAATAALEEAYALRPSDDACAGYLADAYVRTDRLDDARQVVDRAVAAYKGRRTKELAPLYLRLARIARASGDLASEVKWLTTALDTDSQNGEVASEAAVRSLESNNVELANRALRTITLLKTPGPMPKALAYHHMAELARVQSDPKRALMLAKRALAEDATLEQARELVAMLERA